MIHHDLTPNAPLAAHTCGRAPRLIEARGRSFTDSRLLGMPARSFHVECCRCGVSTTPSFSQAVAEAMWAYQAHLVKTSELHALRVAAEKQLAAAA